MIHSGRATIISLLILLLPAWAAAQDLITNTAGRQTLSLNGKWKYIIDPYETGYYNFHAEVYDQANAGSPSAFYNNYHPGNKAELVEYDFDKSPEMNVPGDWNTQSPALLYYEGTVWLRRMFDYQLNSKRRLFVYFGAVNYKAEVYLNGKKLGIHQGGFTPFCFEVTGMVKAKGNYLVVKADNRRQKDAVPAMNTDWWNYGGITRDVLLLDEPENFIRDYQLQLKRENNKMITGYIQMSRAAAGEKIVVRIPALNIEQATYTDAQGRAAVELEAAAVQYWQPQLPRLYQVSIQSAYQQIKEEMGFKTIEAIGPDLLPNGRRVYLRGISIHEEYRGRRANSEADARALLTMAKELGCNFVRLAHYPHNEYMVRMADKMGLLVWEEIPVYWTIDFSNPAVLANAKDQLAAMIARDKNRASVIVWSMANETPLSEQRNSFFKSLVQQARQLDSTRLISAALLTRSQNGVNLVDDAIGEYMDIVAFNQYRGWYGGDLATAPQAKWTTPYNKPVLVSEFGGDALQGLHGSKQERWTEEYQEYLYRQNLLMIENIPHISGISPWILTDFRSPRRVLPGIQDGFNRKGLYSNQGKKKKAFYVLQQFYKKIAGLY